MNNMNFGGYEYPDMNLINNMFLNKNLNNQMNNNSNNMMINNSNLAPALEGYERGNLFNNLYQQYKNYQPQKLVPNNEQAELLLNVGQTTFAAHEIRLYLDVHPDDKEMINLFNKYQKQANDAIEVYEKKYGPILMHTTSSNNMFDWEAYAWPWEREGM